MTRITLQERQTWQLYCGDALTVLRTLPAESVNCVVSSPPYWGQRDYGETGQYGHERTPDEFARNLVDVGREVRRVLKPEGVVWLNLGDSFQSAKGQAGGIDPKNPARRHGLRPNDVTVPGLKPKDLVGIPWLVAFAWREDGWWLRSETIWFKPNGTPQSVKDRPTHSHEHVFLFAKQRHYWYDGQPIRERAAASTLAQFKSAYKGEGTKDYAAAGVQKPTKVKANITKKADEFVNARSVWTIQTNGSDYDHFAVMPKALARKLVLTACPAGGTVLDMFCGVGTTGAVALEEDRSFIGVELSAKYHAIARQRLSETCPLLSHEVSA